MGADMVLINGNVITMNASQPRAQAVAVKDGSIIGVGSSSDSKRWVSRRTKIVDLQGKVVVPGLVDAHAHMLSVGTPLPWIDLRDVDSIREIQRRLAEKVKETGKGKWILGRGWDQDRLKELRYPTRWDLDAVSLDNPVMLVRVCGHIGVANSRALKLAKLDTGKVVSLAGLVDRDPRTGEPTGIVREAASDLVCGLPEPSEKDLTYACMRACDEAVRLGLTGVTWLVDKPDEIYVLQKLGKQRKLKLRINVMVPIACFEQFKRKPIDDPFLRLGCVKIFTDGSLGARTAALKEPYADDPSTKGVLYYSKKELCRLVSRADKAGFQVAVHAIGDLALSETLDAFGSSVSEKRIIKKRHRIEHASVLNPSLIARIKELGLIVCVQPHFVVSDFWVEKRLGPERARWTYALKSMMDAGICIAGSSDTPAEPLNPFLGLWAAVARDSYPEERISVEDALKAYTANAAYFSFEDDVKGSIEVGKCADLTVLLHDPFSVEPAKIKDIRVEMTIVNGQVVYSAKDR